MAGMVERWAKPLLFGGCLLPLVIGGWAFYADRLGANPVEAAIHLSGEWALRLLLATLAFSPLKRLGWGGALRYRRMVGLFSFFYAALHFTLWLWLDRWFEWAEVAADLLERPYITAGFSAFALLVPLAATSTRGMMRRLGRRWQPLHRLIYPAAILAVIHFLWKTRGEEWGEAGVYAAVLALLLGERIVRKLLERRPLT